jgi:hypothetical protein
MFFFEVKLFYETVTIRGTSDVVSSCSFLLLLPQSNACFKTPFMRTACLFVILLLGFSSLSEAAICYKTRVASGAASATCTLNGGAPSASACNSAGSIPYDNAVAGTKDAKCALNSPFLFIQQPLMHCYSLSGL